MHINESQKYLGLWYDAETISKKIMWEDRIISKIGLKCKKKMAVSSRNGIGCQCLSQRTWFVYFMQFFCYFLFSSLSFYFLTKLPEALPKMSQLMNQTDNILGISSYTAEFSLMGRFGGFLFGFILVFKKCHNTSHAVK